MTDLSKLNFLVVDNLRVTRHILRGLLMKIGAQHVDEAEDGAVALAMVKNGHYDFVLSDIMMLNMDGLELLAAIKSDENLRHTTVVLMSSKTRQEIVLRGLQLGAASHFIKYPSEAELAEMIQAILLKLTGQA